MYNCLQVNFSINISSSTFFTYFFLFKSSPILLLTFLSGTVFISKNNYSEYFSLNNLIKFNGVIS